MLKRISHSLYDSSISGTNISIGSTNEILKIVQVQPRSHSLPGNHFHKERRAFDN